MCGLDLAPQPRVMSREEYLAQQREEHWRRAHGDGVSPWRSAPPGVWAAIVATVLLVVGGFGPWATAFGVVSIDGTRGDGWIVIAAGAAAVALTGIWLRGRRRWWVLGLVWVCAAVAGATAGYDLHEARAASDQDFFGERVSLVQPAWGLYLSLGAAALLNLATGALVIDELRRRRSTAARHLLTAAAGALAVLGAVAAISVVVVRVDRNDSTTPTESDAPGSDATQVDGAAATPAPSVDAATDDPSSAAGTEIQGSISSDEVQAVLDLYASAYESEDVAGLSELFTPGFTRYSAGEQPEDRAPAKAVYRRQFAQLTNPAYVLSQVDVHDATTDTAVADARYAITSDAGTVRGAITFDLTRADDGGLRIEALHVQPD